MAEQLRQAQREFEQTIGRPDVSAAERAGAHGTLARAYHAYEFFEAAEAAYAEAMRLAPADGRWPHLLGYLYQQTGRLEDAARMLAAARRIRPDDHAATVRLGQVDLGLNRLREARAQFEEVAEIFPALAQRGLGEVALRERRFADAVTYFNAALQRVPSATSVHYPLAMAYRGLGRMDEARSHLARRGDGDIRIGDALVDELGGLVRGDRAVVIRGRRAYEAGRFQEAADAFTTALARAPDDRGISRALLSALLQLGQQDAAIDLLSRMSAADPDDEDAVVSRALLLATRERYREAVTVLDEADRRRPQRPATRTTLARLLASAPDRAVRDGRRALELAMAVQDAEPSPAHAETVALALAELGRCAEAREWLTRAVTAAEAGGDAGEVARLNGELPRYAAAICSR